MDSKLLTKLNAQAGSTQDPIVWAKAVCRAAAHFAGHGKTQEALAAINVVRAQFGKNLHFDIASWLMLAEGVLHYYRAQFPEAYDRVRRAYGLAIALKNISAFPSCAAWMAHLEYNAGEYKLMAQHLGEAAQTAQPTDYQAIARYSMIIAIGYHISGEFELSRPWYEKARLNAVAEGDNATLSATLHNMAATRASNLRLVECFGGNAEQEIRRVVLERGSSHTYDTAIGLQGLDVLSHMLNGLICTLDRRFDEALIAYRLVDVEAIPARFAPLVYIDRSWCLENIGDRSGSVACTEQALLSISAVSEHDDLAYIYSRLRQIMNAYGRADEALQFKNCAEEALTKHRQFQKNLLETIRSINLTGQK